MSTFFTSDLHFGHKFMAELRGFTRENVEGHDEWLVGNWNDAVKPNDEVWVLGDFSFHGATKTAEFFSRLNGRKHLVRGNHDPNHVMRLPWETTHDLVSRKFMGQSIVMCHYPMLTWANAHHGTWHLHGYCHGNLRAPVSTRMDVGIDCVPYNGPIPLEEVWKILQDREYDYIDHHE